MTSRLFARGTCTKPLLLDGPTGTELERRGYQTKLPLWTALACREVPELLQAIHDDYVVAGADIVTACTFRTTHHTLSQGDLGHEAASLTLEAVAIAKEAVRRAPRPVWVAGSIAPLEDCYHPERTPGHSVLVREHEAHVRHLVDAGVDLLLLETMPTVREALVATQAAVATGCAVVVSFLPGRLATLYDGTPLSEALARVAELGFDLVCVNCGAPSWCTNAMQALGATGRPFGAYANAGVPPGGWSAEPSRADVEPYVTVVDGWLDRGAALVGGCCGTRVEHVARLRKLIDDRQGRASHRPENAVL